MKKYGDNRDSYTKGKAEFIYSVLLTAKQSIQEEAKEQLEIANQTNLSENDLQDVAVIEACPEMTQWDDDPIGDPTNLERSIERFREFFHNLKTDKRLCALARLNGRIVGLLVIGHPPQTATTGSVFIMVSPSHHNRGIGTRLLKQGIHLSRTRGFTELVIETSYGNTAMRKIAEKTGFQLVTTTRARREDEYQTTYLLDPTQAGI